MNVPMIEMPKATALGHLKSYRAALHRRADAEYEAVATAYEALASGKPVLNLREAFALAPLDEKGRPRLCIARADQKQARIVTSGWPRDRMVCETRWRTGRNLGMGLITIMQPPARDFAPGYALVPIVPPAVRKHHALAKCAVLWEVEQWADRVIGARPDVDPVLLRPIGGELWAVLGAWELTAVERAVMAGRI